ncbi:MAG: hypothetical protein QNJ49_09965 [Mastigocoleus sp. MO_167.B18]|nr:hypothetical protein [Mastigocoleus sp. MO_167.B18]
MLEIQNLNPNVELNEKQTGEIVGGAYGAIGGSIVGSATTHYFGGSAFDIWAISGLSALGGAIAGIPGGPVGMALS